MRELLTNCLYGFVWLHVRRGDFIGKLRVALMKSKELLAMTVGQLSDAADGLKRDMAAVIRADGLKTLASRRSMRREYARVLTILVQKNAVR